MALDPALTRVIVSDVHGDHVALRALLEQVGAIDSRGQRNDGFFCLQLGDLAHLGRGNDRLLDDPQVLELGRRWFDMVLCGNHELFHAYGLAAGRWAQMRPHLIPESRDALNALIRDGHLQPAWAVDEWLCTHAGVMERYLYEFAPDHRRTAQAINERFHRRLRSRDFDALFDSVGPETGEAPPGLFWARPRHFAPYHGWANQIVGHTPQMRTVDGREEWTPRKTSPHFWVNDVGAPLSGRLAALVRVGPEGPWEPLVVDRPGGPMVLADAPRREPTQVQ